MAKINAQEAIESLKAARDPASHFGAGHEPVPVPVTLALTDQESAADRVDGIANVGRTAAVHDRAARLDCVSVVPSQGPRTNTLPVCGEDVLLLQLGQLVCLGNGTTRFVVVRNGANVLRIADGDPIQDHRQRLDQVISVRVTQDVVHKSEYPGE